MGQFKRAVIVAPHPDDEVLASGGLIALLALQSFPALILAASDDVGSHPSSSSWPRERLLLARPLETQIALARLTRRDNHNVSVVRGGFADGDLRNSKSAMRHWIHAQLGAGDLVVAPFGLDGHPDHEAVSGAALEAAARSQAGFVQVPIWASHWATAGQSSFPWQWLRRLSLLSIVIDRKRDALLAFRSQIEPDQSTGKPAVLPAQVLSRCLLPVEYFIV